MKEEHPQETRDDAGEPVVRDTSRPPEEFTNPAGLGETECDVQPADEADEPCDPTEVEDQVLGESFPGFGIAGYEGEEVGGG